MSSVQLDSGNSAKSEMSKNGSVKHYFLDDVDEETNHAPIKRTPKKRQVVMSQNLTDAKRNWLNEKAAESVIPTEADAKITPDRIFKGLDPLIVHMCAPCKKFNAARETKEVESGMVEIPLALCTVCRAHLTAQKNLKFFKHDCPALKKAMNL